MAPRLGVTQGLRGYFAVLYDNEDTIQSGIGSYSTAAEAAVEADEWSRAERVPLDESTRALLHDTED